MFCSFYLAVQFSVSYCAILNSIMNLYMLSSKIGLLSEFLYSVLCSRITIRFILWIEVVLCLRHILHGTWTKIRRPSRGMGIVLSHAAIFCHPLSKWLTMLIRRIDRKTSIDQGLKLLSVYAKTLAKFQVRGIFRMRDIRRNVLLKFIEICMETPCWRSSGWAPTWRTESNRNICYRVLLQKREFILRETHKH